MEKINLVEILKDCPKGTKLYSLIFGEVRFLEIVNGDNHPISVIDKTGTPRNFDVMGKYYCHYNDSECVLFPSKDQRDWSKFKYPKPKFDVKTLKPFDKILVRDNELSNWECNIFSHYRDDKTFPIYCIFNTFKYCVPYNDETKYLVGTTEKAQEYYRWWE